MLDKDICELPIMKSTCKTCPFKINDKGFWQNTELASKVIERNLFNSQQICHGTEGKNRKANNRCKGYFDYAFTIYEKLGMNPKENLKNI